MFISGRAQCFAAIFDFRQPRRPYPPPAAVDGSQVADSGMPGRKTPDLVGLSSPRSDLEIGFVGGQQTRSKRVCIRLLLWQGTRIILSASDRLAGVWLGKGVRWPGATRSCHPGICECRRKSALFFFLRPNRRSIACPPRPVRTRRSELCCADPRQTKCTVVTYLPRSPPRSLLTVAFVASSLPSTDNSQACKSQVRLVRPQFLNLFSHRKEATMSARIEEIPSDEGSDAGSANDSNDSAAERAAREQEAAEQAARKFFFFFFCGVGAVMSSLCSGMGRKPSQGNA